MPPRNHQLDDVDEKPESLQQVALFVPPIKSNFNPDAPPETAEEYLQQVIYERNCRVPEVVANHHDRPPDKKHIKWMDIEPLGVENTAPEVYLPTREWCDLQCETFKTVQERISRIREKNLQPESLLDVWDIIQKEGIEMCSKTSPKLKYLIQFSQIQLVDMLQKLSQWRNRKGLPLQECDLWFTKWIYAILSCLHHPLERDDHHNLRLVAKICIQERNSVNPDREFLINPLNLIICIIGKMFGQTDFLLFW
ncbi:Gem-associated protein 2 [Sergentomyia squamirostris]